MHQSNDPAIARRNHKELLQGEQNRVFNRRFRNKEKGFDKGVFARMYASLGCGALSAKCTAGPNILGILRPPGRDARLCRKPLC